MDTLIDLIRHGEPQGGRAYRGHCIDDPLSDKGWSQMWRTVGDDPPWQRIITSPLRRCAEFAAALGERLDIAPLVEERFKEIGFGEWEGKTPDQIRRETPEHYHAFYRDPVHHRPEGAEDLDQFITRVTQAYGEILEQHNGKHCLIVSHAGVMRAIIASILHAEPIGLYKIKIDNAGIARIRHTLNGGVLEYLNR